MNVAQPNPTGKTDPPDRVQIRSIEIDPYPDRRRMKTHLVLEPFQEPPDIEIMIFDSAGEEVASSRIIQPTQNVLELTLHLRHEPVDRRHTMRVLIRNDESEIVSQEEKSFLIPGSSNATRA